MQRSIFALSFFVTTVCFGQTEFGIKAGLNISDIVMTNYINPDVESEFTVKMGLHAGLFMSSVVNEKFGMAAEVVYSNKGFRANPNINLHYITVPLMIQYKLADNIFAEIGPELGYLFSARSDNGNESNIYTNKFDLALDGGFRFNAPRLIFGIRYCAGVFSVREPIESFGLSGNEKIKYQNRVYSSLLVINFSLWKVRPVVSDRGSSNLVCVSAPLEQAYTAKKKYQSQNGKSPWTNVHVITSEKSQYTHGKCHES